MTLSFPQKFSLIACLLLITFSFASCARNNGVTNVSNDELQELLDKGVTLVDIRLPEEWRQTGIIKNSHTITLFDRNGRVAADFTKKLSAIAPTNKPVVLICRTGNRTQAGSQMLLNQLGYQNVFNVTRGIMDWIRNGKPVTPFQ
jgi:rhodanese-related sulfurtransferase